MAIDHRKALDLARDGQWDEAHRLVQSASDPLFAVSEAMVVVAYPTTMTSTRPNVMDKADNFLKYMRSSSLFRFVLKNQNCKNIAFPTKNYLHFAGVGESAACSCMYAYMSANSVSDN